MKTIDDAGKLLLKELPWVNPFQCYLSFYSAMVAFNEAQSCFDNNEYEATVIMCRVAIDCAIYEAISRGENAIDPDFISELGMSDGKNNLIFSVILSTKLNHSEWNELKRHAQTAKIRILTDEECREIKEKIRDVGDFEAHAAQLRDRFLEYTKKGLKAKVDTTPETAEQTLTLTKKYILLIILRFFKVKSI